MSDPIDAATLPLRMRWRPDLESRRVTSSGRRRWIVRDPLTRRHFQFQEEEFSIARLLDGRRSLRDIEQAFTTEWPLLRFSIAHFQGFLARLYRDGLLLDETSGQARRIRQRDQRRQRWSWLAAPSRLLAFRIGRFNPQPVLDALYPRLRWCFSPWCVAFQLLAIVAAAVWVLLHPFEFQSRLPDLTAWLQPRQLFLVAAVLGVTKGLHELGHALACRHFGGECREMGVLMLVFTPCLYCDVGDSWMIANRWRRAAIAAAGMYVEATLAALATFVWWNTQPGWLNYTALATIGVCGASTFVFNGNPLLRYDGYFILSDLVDFPNLWQRSREVLQATAAQLLLGLPRSPRLPSSPALRTGLIGYALASNVYRVIVFVACLQLIVGLFASWHVERFGWLVAAMATISACIPVAVAGSTRIGNPSWRKRVRRGRARLTMAAFAAMIAFTLFVPLPTRVAAPALLQVEQAAPLYVTVPGDIARSLSPGARVAAGDVVAVLSSPEIDRELVRSEGERATFEARVAYLESVRGDSPEAAARLPAARESLEAARQLVEQRQRDVARLSLKASRPGVVLSPPDIAKPTNTTDELSTWSGTPLDSTNRGAHLENGTLIAWIGDPTRREAILFVSESEIERIAIAQSVRLSFASWPTTILSGEVTQIAPAESNELPIELVRGKEVPHRLDDRGVPHALETTYQVRVKLADVDLPPLNRVRGQAKIAVASQSIASRLMRSFRQTFVWSP